MHCDSYLLLSLQIKTLPEFPATYSTLYLPLQALQQENLPKIEPISKQFKLLMKVMEPSHEEQGKIIIVNSLFCSKGGPWPVLIGNGEQYSPRHSSH